LNYTCVSPTPHGPSDTYASPTRRSSDLNISTTTTGTPTSRQSHSMASQSLYGLGVTLQRTANPLLPLILPVEQLPAGGLTQARIDRKSTRLNSSHVKISYADFCLK